MDAGLTKYPKNVNVDFRKLEKSALLKILNHYKGPDMSQTELATLVAKAFEATVVPEEAVLVKFMGAATGREVLDATPACLGEQIAAKVNGSWILGNVLDYEASSGQYAVQDEDDVSRVVTLSWIDIRRLEDSAIHLRKGDSVLAVFPETTCFYRATLAKSPKQPTGSTWEVVVRFEDDEDETGKIPARRVPARFVLRRGLVEDDDSDDESG